MNLETRAFKEELNAHLNKEAAEQARQERIDNYADYLMEPGQDYYPFSPANVAEALGELSSGQLSVLAACLAEAESRKRNDNLANHLALCSIIQPIKEYWRNIAIKDAEEYIE